MNTCSVSFTSDTEDLQAMLTDPPQIVSDIRVDSREAEVSAAETPRYYPSHDPVTEEWTPGVTLWERSGRWERVSDRVLLWGSWGE